MENNIPELVLDDEPVVQEIILNMEAPVFQNNTNEQKSEEEDLSYAEKSAINEFAQKIDIYNSTQMLQYGSAAQKKIASFSESALSSLKAKDIGEVGQMITGLVMELKGFSEEDHKGFKGLFKKNAARVEKIKAKYDSVGKNVDKISKVLEGHKVVLLKDITMLDKMYDMNLDYLKELTMYILAGRKRLAQITEGELPALQEKARLSGKMEDAHAVNDLAERCNRFDKKLHDLDLTRNICLQMAPQIRLVQGSDAVLVEKIQSSIVNTIPLWKNQMVLTLGLAHSKRAIQAQRQVTDITNDLLRKNAEMLKISVTEASKEAERGIVDIQTLVYTNESLIATLDEVLQIQEEGKQKRKEAEGELKRMENQLKMKLLELRDTARIKE